MNTEARCSINLVSGISCIMLELLKPQNTNKTPFKEITALHQTMVTCVCTVCVCVSTPTGTSNTGLPLVLCFSC